MGYLACFVDYDDPQNEKKWKPRKVFLEEKAAKRWVDDDPYKRDYKEIEVIEPIKCIGCSKK